MPNAVEMAASTNQRAFLELAAGKAKRNEVGIGSGTPFLSPNRGPACGRRREHIRLRKPRAYPVIPGAVPLGRIVGCEVHLVSLARKRPGSQGASAQPVQRFARLVYWTWGRCKQKTATMADVATPPLPLIGSGISFQLWSTAAGEQEDFRVRKICVVAR